MAMAVDSRQQSQLGNLGYQHIRYQQPAAQPPQFTNPWGAAQPNAASTHLYSTALASSAPVTSGSVAPVSMPYSTLPISAPSLGAGNADPVDFFGPEDLPDLNQDLINSARSYATYATTAAPNPASYAPTSAPQYQPYQYAQDQGRRSSHPMNSATDAQRQSFNDALDASRGMVQMSQDLTTPRNIYGGQRNSTDGYGFPTTHSAHSSISSASAGYGSYYGGSIAESSVTDYSSASESVDLNSRTLPRPSSLIGAMPPAPQTMMGQFSSKVASSSQKKHKCKICDKRFTRPSSLQTHMYSHTGEKPFACEVEGCGRHFSVVSNLRRHKKVHRNDGNDHPSPEE